MAEEEVRSRSMIRFQRMEALTVNDGSVIYPFIQCQVLVDIHVYGYHAWIEPGGHLTSTTLVTRDPSIKLQFPLQFYHIFPNTNKYHHHHHHLHTAMVQQLLSDNVIPQRFWDDFINTVALYLRYSADYAIQRKSGGLVLHVELQVLVKEENSNVQSIFAHINPQQEEFIDGAIAETIEDIDGAIAETIEDYVPSAPESWWDLLAGFETVTFKKTTTGAFVEQDADADADAAVCSICLDPYKEGVKISKMPCNNAHWFHSGCILKWLIREWLTKKKKTCPICRWPFSMTINLCFEWIPTSKYLY